MRSIRSIGPDGRGGGERLLFSGRESGE